MGLAGVDESCLPRVPAMMPPLVDSLTRFGVGGRPGSDEGRRRYSEAFTQSADLTKVEFAFAGQDFGNDALTADFR